MTTDQDAGSTRSDQQDRPPPPGFSRIGSELRETAAFTTAAGAEAPPYCGPGSPTAGITLVVCDGANR